MSVSARAALRAAALLAGTLALTGCGQPAPPAAAPRPAPPRVLTPDEKVVDFSQEHLPLLETVLAELEQEITKRTAALAELEKELAEHGRGQWEGAAPGGRPVPPPRVSKKGAAAGDAPGDGPRFLTTDETHARWKAAIERLRQNVAALKEQRKEAYLAFRKYQIAQGSADDHHKKRVEQANAAVVESQKAFKDALRDFEGR